MLSRRQVYSLAVTSFICLIYVFQSTIYSTGSSATVLVPVAPPVASHSASPLLDVVSMPASPEPIVMTLVLMGQDAAHEGHVAIKSALMHSSRPLNIHLICTEDALEILESKFQLVKRPYYPLNITFHVVSLSRVQERLERANIGTAQDTWPLLTKLLMHEILIGVEKTIFVDTDMIFVVDPVQLWDSFDTLGENTLIALPTLGASSHAGEICTCVMLVHLERMRKPEPNSILIPSALISGIGYKDVFSSAFEAAERDSIPNYHGHHEPMPFNRTDPPYGDQGIFFVLWLYRRELFTHLSLRWDITQCRASYGLRLWGFLDKNGNPNQDDSAITISEEEHIRSQGYRERIDEGLIIPGILHFNCQETTNVWTMPLSHDTAIKTWAPMVTSAVRYKWVWLNRGNGSATVSINKKFSIRFLDEEINDAYNKTHL